MSQRVLVRAAQSSITAKEPVVWLFQLDDRHNLHGLWVNILFDDNFDVLGGPFQTTMLRATKCAKSTLPIDKNPPVFLNVEVYNTTSRNNLLRGNVTILTDCKNKKIKAKGFFWEQNKWKLVYLMNNIGCSSIFMPIVTLFLGVKYDQKNCIVFKGKYSFEGLDTNKMQHLFATVQDYGRIKWRNEFFSQAGSVFCWDFETLVEPAATVVKRV